MTSDEVHSKTTIQVLGLVMASSVRAKHVARDIMAAFRNLAGGEIKEYSKLLADSREVAVQRIVDRAEELGANAVVGTRFITAGIMGGASEILAYGAAVVIDGDTD